MYRLALRFTIWATLHFLCVNGACAIAGEVIAPSVSFDTDGGDTWLFDRDVTGSVQGGKCDAVLVNGPAGSFRARQRDGRFFAKVHLRSGINPIRAVCWRAGNMFARSPAQSWIVRAPDRPRARIRTRLEGHSILLDAGDSELAPGIPAPIVSYVWSQSPGDPTALTLGGGKRRSVAQPGATGTYHVTVRITDELGRDDESSVVLRVREGNALAVDADTDAPDWLQSVVVYGIALPTVPAPVFGNVLRHLDAIVATGANSIWLSPVTDAPAGDFGYAVTDHFGVRASLGSTDELRGLISAAHARNLKVFMDMAVNHLSRQHRYSAAAVREGGRSPYFAWFDRDSAGRVTHYFDWQQLENLNYDNPDVRAYVTAAFVYWAREFGVDGFRVDAAWAVRQRAPDFWPRLASELRRIDPALVLIAEASALDPHYAAQGFDAAYDWSLNLGEWAWQRAFAGEKVPDLAQLRAALARSVAHDSTTIRVFRFLNNNDTGVRFLTRHGSQETISAMTLMFTIPGWPSIYEGDEQGVAFEPYRSGVSVPWGTSAGVFTGIYGRLAGLRRLQPALRSNELQMVSTDHDTSVLAFLRPGNCDIHAILVLLNFAEHAAEVRLRDPLPAKCQQHGDASSKAELQDLLNGDVIAVRASLAPIPMDAHQNRVLRLD